MAKPFSELKKGMSKEREERVQGRIDRELLEMNLAELRSEHADLTQTQVGELLEVTQGAIAQLEKRQDATLSKLAAYVKALGGQLEVVARFQDREDVRITQFEGVKEQLESA